MLQDSSCKAVGKCKNLGTSEEFGCSWKKLHVAQVVTHASRPRVDFVGHVGGDDFVFLMRSQDWSLRITLIFRREDDEWRLVHRRADPLTRPIGPDLLAAIARGDHSAS